MRALFEWLPLILQISVILQVFAVGINTSWDDATYLFRRPKQLLNSILARNVAVPIIAIILIKTFSFHVAVAITLGVLAVTPVPPLLPRSQIHAGCRSGYVIGLLVSQAILSILLAPVTIHVMNLVLGTQTHFSAVQVAELIVKTILMPLAAGMLVSSLMPEIDQYAPDLLLAGTVLLIVGAIPLLILAWRTFGSLVGNGAMLALALFTVAGTLVGHVLGGPAAEDRTALAMATSSRHPGLALAIAVANYPEQKMLIAGAVVIYLLIRTILFFPYVRWRHTVVARRTVGPHPGTV
jgi:BASS family bile acid:Na+ symporter